MAGNYLEAFAKAERAAEREERARLRELDALEREAKRRYVGSRASEVDLMNHELDSKVHELESLLTHSLRLETSLDFTAFKTLATLPVFDPGLLARRELQPRLAQFVPEELRGLRRLAPGAQARYERDCETGHEAFERALREHDKREAKREAALEAAKRRYYAEVEEIERRVGRQHAEVDALEADFNAGVSGAVAECFSRVLNASSYPSGFPRSARATYFPGSNQLVVEYDLPALEIVPEVASYGYFEADDKIAESSRGVTSRQALYTSVIAQVALRSIHEVFDADVHGRVGTVVFNGHVETIDAGTGRPVHPCIVTLHTTRAAYSSLDLSKVEPVACLRTLNASISPSLAELAPVPASGPEVFSDIDQRPSLMSLTPGELESLIIGLFERMGLMVRQTQATQDGGVEDGVTCHPRLIFGGPVVIQAARGGVI